VTVLLGVADASHFRVKVGRYGDRWYADPLPADDIAPAAPDEAWPSISTVKKASGNDWSYVAMKRAAHAPLADLELLPTLDPARRYDALKSINAHGLNVAAGRGTIVHWWGEDMLHGRPPRKVTPQMLTAHRIPAESLELAKPYGRALRAWFDAYQPELVATEYVTIDRHLHGVGYGGTPDGLMGLDGIYAYDFKTRSGDGDHAAYPEEGAQIAAGVRAEYMIVGEGGEAHRAPVPKVDGGLIISIKPDGVRMYPVDIDRAYEHWIAMHAWWLARRTERDGIGRPWPVRTAAPFRPNVEQLAAVEVPSTSTAAESSAELAPLARVANSADTRTSVVATLGHAPDEGDPVPPAEFDELRRRYDACSDDARAWFKRMREEASAASLDFIAHTVKTTRRYYLYLGLIRLGEHGLECDEIARACVAYATSNDVALSTIAMTGHVIGSLDATSAALFSDACGAYAAGELVPIVGDDELMRLRAA
jgi:hypothetical protein